MVAAELVPSEGPLFPAPAHPSQIPRCVDGLGTLGTTTAHDAAWVNHRHASLPSGVYYQHFADCIILDTEVIYFMATAAYAWPRN